MTPTIQERSELQIAAIIEDSFPYLEEHSPSVQRRIKQATRNAYIAGATEQQALSEARIKELEQALTETYRCLHGENNAWSYVLKSKIIKILKLQNYE